MAETTLPPNLIDRLRQRLDYQLQTMPLRAGTGTAFPTQLPRLHAQDIRISPWPGNTGIHISLSMHMHPRHAALLSSVIEHYLPPAQQGTFKDDTLHHEQRRSWELPAEAAKALLDNLQHQSGLSGDAWLQAAKQLEQQRVATRSAAMT